MADLLDARWSNGGCGLESSNEGSGAGRGFLWLIGSGSCTGGLLGEGRGGITGLGSGFGGWFSSLNGGGRGKGGLDKRLVGFDGLSYTGNLVIAGDEVFLTDDGA